MGQCRLGPTQYKAKECDLYSVLDPRTPLKEIEQNRD